MRSVIGKAIVAALAASVSMAAADSTFLRRQIADVKPQPDELTAGAKAASYKALFGMGDADADQLKSVARYGELTLGPAGASAVVSYPAEEQMYFVEEGGGTLLYGGEKAPVKKNDFMYLPVGVQHGLANSSGAPLKVIVMGYKIPANVTVQPTPKLMLASTDDIQLQILGQHGPTSQFKLMMGTTSSTRDKLPAAYVMNSLFILDFAPGGTNIPHNHPDEEEIYLLLRGSGDMVADKDADGKDIRHPSTEGAVYLFKPGCQVGYYSNAKEGQPHDLILAARSTARVRAPRPQGAGRGQ